MARDQPQDPRFPLPNGAIRPGLVTSEWGSAKSRRRDFQLVSRAQIDLIEINPTAAKECAGSGGFHHLGSATASIRAQIPTPKPQYQAIT
jgi:hypothetical protein